MVDLSLYREILGVHDISGLVDHFQRNLIITNRTADFFVDWNKVKQNAEALKIELSLLNSLIGSKTIEQDLRKLLSEYPETVRAIPILVAVRDLEFPIIIDFFDIERGIKELDFNKTKASKLVDEEIDTYIRFIKNSGLITLFSTIKNFYDYVLGVEVGMDTNARKNRSGKAMEQLVKPFIDSISRELGCTAYYQKKFSSVSLYGKVPKSLANRKADFIVFTDDTFINIEVNYYAGAGSKPEEIVDSYINRKNELQDSGWNFIWITDGNVWKGSESQLTKAFNEMDHVMNINFINRGILKEALTKIIQQ